MDTTMIDSHKIYANNMIYLTTIPDMDKCIELTKRFCDFWFDVQLAQGTVKDPNSKESFIKDTVETVIRQRTLSQIRNVE